MKAYATEISKGYWRAALLDSDGYGIIDNEHSWRTKAGAERWIVKNGLELVDRGGKPRARTEWYDKYIGKKFVGDAGKVVTFEGVFHEQKYDAKQNRVYETGRLQYSFYYIEDDASDYVAYKEARAIFKRPWKGGDNDEH